MLEAFASTAFLGTAIAVLTWPIRSIVPAVGPDPSWVAGLYMAHGEGLHFGTQFVFTYGPLGFLQQPALYDEGMWMLAFIYSGFIHIALSISLLWVARRGLPLAVALGACYTLLVIGRLEGAVVLLAFVWCIVALGDRPPKFAASLIVFGGATVGAVELLGKANFGFAVLSLCAVTLAGLPGRRRNLGRFLAVAAIALGVFWALAGQGLSNVPDFAANTLQILAGYSSAMPVNLSDVRWERPFGVATALLLVLAASTATWRDPLPRRLATLVVVALFGFLAFKQGFVRQEVGRTAEFFLLMLGGAIALASTLPAWLSRPSRRLLATGLIAPLVAIAIATLPTPSFWRSLEWGDHLTFLRQEARALLVAGERARFSSEGRTAMRAVYRLDRKTLSLLGDRPVQIDPWEIGVAWAYRLNWHPLPVPQSYSAYVSSLDLLNAEALRGATAPALILRQNQRAFASSEVGSIDGRYQAWDAPAANRAMLCNYDAVHTTARWQLLERTGSRCGPPRPIGIARSDTGDPIRVPPPPGPRDIVFARIEGLGDEGWESLRTVLYRGRQRTVTVNGGPSWRLVPETAGDGLIMRVPEGVDYPKPFRLAPAARTFSVQVQGAPSRRIDARFFAQRVAVKHDLVASR